MKLGFIGAGNMASTIINGLVASAFCHYSDITVSDISEQARENLAKKGVIAIEDNKKAVEDSDVIFLAVKPQFAEIVIREVAEYLPENAVLVSIAAGKDLSFFSDIIGKDFAVVRTMPNTPALVGEGITAVCPNKFVSKSQLETVIKIFNSFGKAEVVSEALMPAVVGVSGSSPAYIFMIIEAMADAAVAEGMPRKQAYTFAAQAVLGSAKMVLESGLHPAELKDMVCSPAGTTIEAVCELENSAVRSGIIKAVRSSAEKSRKL